MSLGAEPAALSWRRRQIFLALVDAQDHDVGVAPSRRLVAERFGVSEGQVRQIEREGLERQWSPLCGKPPVQPGPPGK